MGYSTASAQPVEAPQAEGMKPRLIKGMQADYTTAAWPGENTSGLIPYGPNVLVCMDACSSTSAGGVMLPDDIIERMSEASVTGCIFAMGETAFRGEEFRPGIGQRIYIDKYSGIKARGLDGSFYRIVDEKCIACGIIDHPPVQEG